MTQAATTQADMIAAAQAARLSGAFDAAQAIADDAMALFPEEAWPLLESGQLALQRNDTGAAVAIARLLRARFPHLPAPYRLGIQALHEAQRAEDALAWLNQAMLRFPAMAWADGLPDEIARLLADRGPTLAFIGAVQCHAPALPGPVMPMRKRVVVVLGMHRGGTSACMRIIQALGVDLGGPLLLPGPENLDGYQEHAEILHHHWCLLRAAEAEWHTPRLIRPLPAGFFESAAVAEIAGNMARLVAEQMAQAQGIWGFKDPRTARFLPLWCRIFEDMGVEPVWVLALRDPRAVAASLHARDAMPVAVGELLWLEHYLDALRHLGPRLACVVRYERWFDAPAQQVCALANAIGGVTDQTIAGALGTIRPGLRHFAAEADVAALGVAQDFHAALCAASPDLAALQAAAETTWRRLEHLSKAGAMAGYG